MKLGVMSDQINLKSGECIIHYRAGKNYIVDVRSIDHVAVTDNLHDGLMTLVARLRTLAIELENLALENK